MTNKTQWERPSWDEACNQLPCCLVHKRAALQKVLSIDILYENTAVTYTIWTNILPQNQWGVGCFVATVVGSVLRHPFQVTILQMCLPQIEAFTHSERTSNLHFRTEGLQYGIFMDFQSFPIPVLSCICIEQHLGCVKSEVFTYNPTAADLEVHAPRVPGSWFPALWNMCHDKE